jgi:hypothetical protein
MAGTDPVATQPLLADVAPTPWAEARQHLAGGGTYWLATVHPAGPTCGRCWRTVSRRAGQRSSSRSDAGGTHGP